MGVALAGLCCNRWAWLHPTIHGFDLVLIKYLCLRTLQFEGGSEKVVLNREHLLTQTYDTRLYGHTIYNYEYTIIIIVCDYFIIMYNNCLLL